MTSTSSKHVFMSYSRKDDAVMRRVLKYLRKQGIKVWLDNEKLTPGTPIWEKEIEKAIKAAAAVVVICSPDSNESEWVRREITFAERYHKRIFPLLARGDEETSISIRLSTSQFVDIRKNENAGLSAMSTALSSYVDEREEGERRESEEIRQKFPSPRAASPQGGGFWRGTRDVGRSKPTWLPFTIAGFAVLGLIFGGTFLYQNVFAPGEPTPTESVSETNTPGIPQACDGTEDYGPIKIGSTVVLNKHTEVDGDENWDPAMDEFVGQQAVVTEFFGADRTDCPAVRVDVDGGTWVWRVRSLTLVDKPLVLVPTMTFSPPLGIGSKMLSEKDGMMMVYVPAGEFQMGLIDLYAIALDSFWIDQTEVTNGMYAKCVEAGKCNPPISTKSSSRNSYYGDSEYEDYPVIFVSWNDALAYCDWAERRLPTEAEWEKAASWDEESQTKREYPWGDAIDESYANYNENIGDTTAVGSYEKGTSFYGSYDMGGNVWEWVSSLYQSYPYNAKDGREDLLADGNRVMRGGSWANNGGNARTFVRQGVSPANPYLNIGFRCASDAEP